jgi:hypothetical protein
MNERIDRAWQIAAVRHDQLGGVAHQNLPIVEISDSFEVVVASLVDLLASPGDVDSRLDAASLAYPQRVFLLAILAETVSASLSNYATATGVTYSSALATMVASVRTHLGAA